MPAPPLQYYLSRMRKLLDNPVAGLNYFTEAALGKARIRLTGEYASPSDRSVVEESWDVLVVLDACRYDSLQEHNPFDAVCEEHRSQAPNTEPWFMKNFMNVPAESTSDIVYVTANPKTSEALDDDARFYKFERAFETHWDSSVHSVLPDELTDIALKRAQEYPDKRLIVHYLQPHGPFVGSDRPDLHLQRYAKLQRNEVSLETVLEAYHTCLSHALSEVQRLVDGVSGEVVVTADHGESFGEAGIYAHPPWANSKVLLNVPWISVDGGENPPEYTTQALTHEREDSVAVKDQLESLGYH